MSSAGNTLRLRENLAGKFGERELRPQRFQATMGDGTGAVSVPGKPNYVYIRRVGRGLIEECLNNKATVRDGLPVIAGYSHESPEVLQILEVDWTSFSAPGNYSYVQHHHEAHELNNTSGGDDVVWVQSQQFMPLLVYPTSPATMFVNVFGGWYPWAGGWHYFEPVLSADLTARIPPGVGQARYVLISIDGATELLQYTNGPIFPTWLPPVDAENMLPAPPAGSIPTTGVYLPFGVTALDWPNLYDIRLFNQPVGGSVTPAAHALLDSTVHSDTVTNAPLEGSLVIGNATPAWDDLVHPGAAGYALVSGAVTFAWSLTPTWLGTHTWGSGFAVMPTDATGQDLGAAGARWDLHTQSVLFEGATGSNVITIPDNVADALHISDVGGLEHVRIVSTNANPYLLIDPGAAGILVGIGIAAPGVTLDALGAHVAAVGLARFKGTAASGFMTLDTTTGGAGDEGGFLINLGGIIHGQFGARGDDTVYIKNRVFGLSDIITITSAGLVGVRIQGPDGTLHVHTATAGVVTAVGSGDDLVVENSGSGGISILVPDASEANLFFGSPGDAVGAVMRWVHDSDLLTIGTANAGAEVSIVSADIVEAIRIDSAQDVGIGVAPTHRLTVKTDIADSFAAYFFNDGDNVNRFGIAVQCGADNGAAIGTTQYLYAYDGNAGGTGAIQTINGVFGLVDVSDERRKINVIDTKLVGLDIINQLKVRDYNWKTNPEGSVMTSFVAQEAQGVYPALISEMIDGTLGTVRAMLIPVLTKAVQELDARLTKLEAT